MTAQKNKHEYEAEQGLGIVYMPVSGMGYREGEDLRMSRLKRGGKTLCHGVQSVSAGGLLQGSSQQNVET